PFHTSGGPSRTGLISLHFFEGSLDKITSLEGPLHRLKTFLYVCMLFDYSEWVNEKSVVERQEPLAGRSPRSLARYRK
ncbi:6233_t:CDS:1, partial [Rhizophagus irregularis]